MRRHLRRESTHSSALNARLAVRQAVADLVNNPESTLANVIRNGNINLCFKRLSSFSCSNKLIDPIHRLVLVQLESIYDRIQCEILSLSNTPPSSHSILKFLQLYDGESSKDIVQRFENQCVSARMREIDEWRKIGTSPLNQLRAAPKPTNVPPLDKSALLSDSGSSVSLDEGVKNEAVSSAVLSDRGVTESMNSSDSSMHKIWSQSSLSEQANARSSSVSSQPAASDHLMDNEQTNQLDEIAKKVTARLMNDACFVEQLRIGGSSLTRAPNGVLTGESDLVEHIQKVAQEALPTLLSKTTLIPSVPVLEIDDDCAFNTSEEDRQGDKRATSAATRSSHRSQGNATTSRYIPPIKPSTAEASVGTEWPEQQPNTVTAMVEKGVSTENDHLIASQEKLSSSNPTEELSVGQIPQKAVDKLLLRKGINVVTIRSDGSVLPTYKQTSNKRPSVREWHPPCSHRVTIVTSPSRSPRTIVDPTVISGTIHGNSDDNEQIGTFLLYDDRI
ncbi:unnamed protein product [Anisakis simplex]|uniref:L27 domain-containing protein n=1 Tax=Anisakis simplex TaxID=6269 RepID=A0A0M3JYI8_ANISI|nr:unnamed protein product [Anisakis simplex]